jgi:hypothetical protein
MMPCGVEYSFPRPCLQSRHTSWIRGADTPALCSLAGLDLGHFDPRDASDIFGQVIAETAALTRPLPQRLDSAAQMLGLAWTVAGLHAEAALKRFYRLAVAMDYPNHDEVMRLYGLDDKWEGAGAGRGPRSRLRSGRS